MEVTIENHIEEVIFLSKKKRKRRKVTGDLSPKELFAGLLKNSRKLMIGHHNIATLLITKGPHIHFIITATFGGLMLNNVTFKTF